MICRDGANTRLPDRDLTAPPCFSFPLNRDFLLSGVLHKSPFPALLGLILTPKPLKPPKNLLFGSQRGWYHSHTELRGAVRFSSQILFPRLSNHLLTIGKQILFPLFPSLGREGGMWLMERCQPPFRPAAVLGGGFDKRAGFPVSPTHPSQGIHWREWLTWIMPG